MNENITNSIAIDKDFSNIKKELNERTRIMDPVIKQQNELLNITEIETTSSKDEANAFLSTGWRLLSILTKHNEERDEFSVYCIGWPNPLPAKIPEFQSPKIELHLPNKYPMKGE